MKTPRRKYKVWFQQINGTMLEVNATSTINAIDAAKRKWRREYGMPLLSYVEQLKMVSE